MSDKVIESFDGVFGGATYDLIGRLTGFGPGFYREVAWAMPLEPGMRVLDLGCGTCNLGLAVAGRIGPSGAVVGVDISEKQLARARRKTVGCATPFELHCCSMDELPFDDASFDAVVTSLAMHGAPPEVRRAALGHVRRVLRDAGFFALADVSRPRFGPLSLLWLPTIFPTPQLRDNLTNAYPEICRSKGLARATDVYVNSLVDHGRDRPCGRPPVQIPACATNALGSCLGYDRRIDLQARDASCEQAGATASPGGSSAPS